MNLRLSLSAPLAILLLCIASFFPAAASAAVTAPKEPVTILPAISLKVGTQTVHAELAINDETRQKGMMFREKMGKNEGMLFVFPEIAYHAMWMRNTPLPLSVAFVDQAGKIVSIHEMQPFTDTTHQAAGPARYALEMSAEWFAKNQVKVGDTIKGLEKAPKPQ